MFSRYTNKIEPVIQRNPNIFQALKWFYFLNKLFMVAPYTIHISTNKTEIKVISKYDIIYYIRTLFVLISLSYGLTFYFSMAVRFKVVQAVLNIVSLILIIPIIFITRSNIAKLMLRISELETKLAIYGIKYNYKKLFRTSLVEIFLILLFSIISQVLEPPEFTLLRKLLLFGLFVLPNAIVMLFLCQYINFSIVCSDWLQNLDDYLKELLVSNFEANVKLNNARRIFHYLWDTTYRIEDVFQVPILIVLGITFLNTAAFVYLWIVVIKINPSTYIWFSCNILKISVLPFMCERCKKKVL